MQNRFLKRMYEFQERNEITRAQLKEMVLDLYQPFRVFTRKKDGGRYTPEAFTIQKTLRPRYTNNNPQSYMVVQVLDDHGTGSGLGFRTIILDNVYKIEKDGRTYLVR